MKVQLSLMTRINITNIKRESWKMGKKNKRLAVKKKTEQRDQTRREEEDEEAQRDSMCRNKRNNK